MLHWAAWNKQGELVRYFLGKGVEVNYRNPKDQAPIHWAAMGGDIPCIKAMLDAGADINSQVSSLPSLHLKRTLVNNHLLMCRIVMATIRFIVQPNTHIPPFLIISVCSSSIICGCCDHLIDDV
jgi:ankyrin repeat protein